MRRSPSAVLAACCLTVVLVMASVAGVNLALKDLALELGASSAQLTWVADAYTVALAALVLPFGAIGDDFGRRRALIAGTAIFGLAALAATFADSAGLVIACRAVMGIGAALAMPPTLSTITAVFPADRRDRAVGVWAGFASAGAVLGLLLSGSLLEAFSWRSTFLALAVMAAVAVVANVLLVPDTRGAEEPAVDLGGAALSAIGIGALVFGLIEGADRGWDHVVSIGAFALAAIALSGWALQALRRERPMLDPRLFALRGFSTGFTTLVIQFLGTFGFFYVGLQYLQLVLGYGPLRSALAFLPMAAVVMPLSSLSPRLVRRSGSKPWMAAGLVSMAVGFLLAARLGADSPYWQFLIALLIFSGGLALSATPSTNSIVSALPPSKQGVASAVNDVTREFGAALGIALLGSLFNSAYADRAAGLVAGLPPEAATHVKDSAAAGLEVAADPRLGAHGPALADGVRDAFVHGMSQSFHAGAIVVLAALAFVLVVTPRRNAPVEKPVEPAVVGD
ncbi:MFS transporter [Kribbella sp. NPDC051718]|uniref:MFS transporter n=1 Tax=Kribbella sp. NPDC051718 TaxID=3155168 RepID=UPI00342D7936